MAAIEVRYANCDGVDLAFCQYGSGPCGDILLVPGLMGHLEFNAENPFYRTMIERLAQFGRLVVFDTRGTGLSGGAPLGDAEQQMADIGWVMDAAGIERASVIGAADSGAEAILFAAMHPTRVARLILYETSARRAEDVDYPGLDAASHDRSIDWIRANWGNGEWFKRFTADVTDVATVMALFQKWERNIATPTEAVNAVQRWFMTDVRYALHAITAPTLVVHHRGDQVFPESHAAYIAGNIVDSDFRLIKGCGNHVSMRRDWGDRVVDEMERFLTGNEPATRQHERVLATVLFVDIVASTARSRRDGDDRWAELLMQFHRTSLDIIDDLRGRFIKSTGDGLLATFDGPGRGVDAAAMIIRQADALGLDVRAGLHTGEVELVDGDIGGIAVHIAARIESAAAPGEVLVSSTVNDLMTGSDRQFESRGRHRLKGIEREWDLYAAVNS